MTDREAFEQDYRKRKHIARLLKFNDGRYVLDDANSAWDAWQAALAYVRPEGYRLVPDTPTEAMVEAGDSVAVIHHEWGEDHYIENTDAVYRAMIAAAPPAPQTGGEGE